MRRRQDQDPNEGRLKSSDKSAVNSQDASCHAAGGAYQEGAGWTLLVEDGFRLTGPDVTEALARHLGITPLEAGGAVRYSGGIVAESLPEEKVRALAADLETMGVLCRAVEDDTIPMVPPVRRIPRIAGLEDEQLVLTDLAGETTRIDRLDVWALAVHAVTQPMRRVPLSSREAKRLRQRQIRPINMPGEIERLREEIGETHNEGWDLELVLSLYSANPVLILEGSHKDLTYSHLAERLQQTSLENFLTTARDLSEWAKLAFKPAETLAFLEEPAVAMILAGNPRELQRRRIWTLASAIRHRMEIMPDSGEYPAVRQEDLDE